MEYSISGLAQKQTCPKMVSGRRVAATRKNFLSSHQNFRRVYSWVSARPPLDMSVSLGSTATGPWTGQKGA